MLLTKRYNFEIIVMDNNQIEAKYKPERIKI